MSNINQPPSHLLADTHQLTFITGMHRSGTSLLFRCLRDHPQISGFNNTGVPEDEGQHLQTIIPSARAYGGPGRFGFEPAAYLDETSTLATQVNAAQMLAEWAPYWDLSKPILIEKSPTTLIRTRFFQKLFPSAKFVIVLRHPLPVTFATYKWKGLTIRKRNGMSMGHLLEHWLLVHEKAAADFKRLNRVKIIFYEDLVAHPQKVIRSIYDFLKIENTPLKQEIRPNINKKYFERWQRMRRHPLKSIYAFYLMRHFENRINQFGYSLIDPSRVELPDRSPLCQI